TGAPATIDGPKASTRPWTATIPFRLLPDTELLEDACENERDAKRIEPIASHEKREVILRSSGLGRLGRLTPAWSRRAYRSLRANRRGGRLKPHVSQTRYI